MATKRKSKKSKKSPEETMENIVENFSLVEENHDQGFGSMNIALSEPIQHSEGQESNPMGGILSTMGNLASQNKLLTVALLSGSAYGIYSLMTGKDSENPPQPVVKGNQNLPTHINIEDDYDDALLGIDDDEFEEMLFADDITNDEINPEFQPLSFG